MTDRERRVVFKLRQAHSREWGQLFELVAPQILHRLSLALYSEQKAEDLTHELVALVIGGIQQMALDSADGAES